MSPTELLLVITGGLSIGLIVALIQAYERFRGVESEKHALKAQLVELHTKLKAEAEQFRHTANQVRAYYDEKIEREEKKIEETSALHKKKAEGILKMIEESEKRVSGWEVFLNPPPLTPEKRERIRGLWRQRRRRANQPPDKAEG